LFRDLAVGLAV
jgi:3-dehydroquinate dehydratase-2